MFTRSLFAVSVALLVVAGCDHAEPDPKPLPPEPVAPEISVEPEPGFYDVYALDVTVKTGPGYELTYTIGRDPNPEIAEWTTEPVKARLVHDAAVRVLARGADGTLWGPYSYEYRLAKRDLTGSCEVAEPVQKYYGAAAKVALTVTYSLPTALAAVELRIAGDTKASLTSAENPRGTATLEMPPLGQQGAYDVQCVVTAPEMSSTEGNVVTVFVDATAPSAAWQPGQGWSAPTHFKLQASDLGGAQVAGAELCDGSVLHCLPMQKLADGVYGLATAFLAGSTASFSVVARVYDGAGNVTQLAAPAVSASDFPAVTPPYLNPITLVTEPVFDLDAYLVGAGQGAPADVRTLDFTPVTGTALPLHDGWNEFLFRPAGKASWQTYGIYRAGVAIDLPARAPGATHDWLVFAGNSTLPALQADLVAAVPVTSDTWARAWFDIPHLLWAEDLDGDGQWDDGEPYYYPPATDNEGLWLRRGRQFVSTLTQAVESPAAGTQTADFDCVGCASGKRLRLQRRTGGGRLLGRDSLAVDLAAGAATGVPFAADATDVCLFYWDEDDNGLPNAAEPRTTAPCTAGVFTLAHAAGLSVTAEAGAFEVAGIPYGGAVTGFIDVTATSGVVVRTPIGALRDLNGTGRRRVSRAGWSGTLRVWSAATYAETEAPASPEPATTQINVTVHDEAGQTVAAAAIEARSGPSADFKIFDAAVSATVAVAYEATYRPRLRALSEGHLSEWAYADDATVALRLISPAAAGRAYGYVRDAAGFPVTGAVVTWDADPYTAQTQTGADGAYSLAALGSGKLAVTRLSDETSTQRTLSVEAGQQLRQDWVLPALGAGAWPAGLLTTLFADAISGAAPVTLYTNSHYAWSPLFAGEWSLSAAPNLQRRFVTPGALPGIALADPAWLYISWSPALLESTLEMRCGARLQTLPFGTSPLVDSPCWEWYANWNGYGYFLGRPDPVGGVPNAGLSIFYAEVVLNGTAAPFTTLVLRDLLFGRTLTAATDAVGRIRIALPHGVYRAETQLGGILHDGAATQFRISHVPLGDRSLSYP